MKTLKKYQNNIDEFEVVLGLTVKDGISIFSVTLSDLSVKPSIVTSRSIFDNLDEAEMEFDLMLETAQDCEN
jgi:hypothetical protein